MDHSLRGYLSRRTNQELKQIILLYQHEEDESSRQVVALAMEILNNRQGKEQ